MDFDYSKLEGLSEKEKEYALSILKEFSEKGKSEKYEDLLYNDYSEIPVDISTFIHDKRYLGNAMYDKEGRFTVFPFWEEKLKDIFPTNIETNYNTIVFTGAIGLGKSTIAVICLLYMLYRLLCLKDPYIYYGLQPIDKISISLMNITIENAKGVALDKMNQMILSSQWFMEHGEMTGTTNLVYRPEKHIELITASSNNQVIGRAIFCLDGDTEIVTTNGAEKIKDLVDKNVQVISLDKRLNQVVSNVCTVKPTVKSNEEYQIELEDGTVIKCTQDHLLMLADGTYKAAKDLTEDDELAEAQYIEKTSYKEFIDNITSKHPNIMMKIKSIKKVTMNEEKQFYDVIEANPFHNFLIKTNKACVVSHNCNFSDEVNWGITNDTEKLKKKYKQLISQIDARMKSRFLRGTKLPTLNIIASSKNNEQSFLEDFISTKKKNESKNTLIVDEAQWVVDSRKDSPEKFYVAVGNKFLANELLPEKCPQSLVDEYRARGYSMLQVPIGYLENFQTNIDGALTDIAGISTASSVKYMSGIRWNEVKTNSYKNPFTKDEIEVGNARDDIAQYSDFFDLNLIPVELRAKPWYIHLDLSKSGDDTGIAGVVQMGKRPTQSGGDASRDMFYRLGFSVSIKAPRGFQISFEKNRTFIRWLKSNGFNIKGVSSDTFQNAQIQQQLVADGFDVSTVSVDRLDTETKQCLPYAYFKSTVYDRRIEVYEKCDLLTEEVLGLERESDGHINHPENGTVGSKDQADAVCGALWNASKHAEQFAFDYGEMLDAIEEGNLNSEYDMKKQLTVDFEKTLSQMSNPLGNINKDKGNNNSYYSNFSNQYQDETAALYAARGILVI